MMAAEELGIPYDKVRAVVADTSSLGFNDITEGSRVTFSTGLATIEAARDAIGKLCGRAAKIWGIPAEAVVWEKGHAKPSGANAGNFEPLSLADIAKTAGNTGGPIAGHFEVNADGAGVSFAIHIADAEVDPRDRPHPDHALHRGAGCRQGRPSELCRRSVPGRCRPGHRLGAQRGVHLRRGRPAAERGLPRLPHPGRLGPADDRHGHRRDAQSRPSLRRARGRRDLDRAAAGGRRQCVSRPRPASG